eukprot:TRINITY_DN6145_c0_g1_i1.p1 TRINITY_DN6145_c0_g1~~TRINITY_DN6145_c0_g1_i1.p1  ORF type:complete len:1374 (-),score=306.25 TRINITY_DN6145_c0_g1_i1:2899-7020(-)
MPSVADLLAKRQVQLTQPVPQVATKFDHVAIFEQLRITTITRELVAALLPGILSAIRSRDPELKIGGFMSVAELCTRTVLSSELIAVLVDAIATKCVDATVEEALTCLVYICQTQPVKSLSERAFKSILQLRALPHHMRMLTGEYDTSKFIKLLLEQADVPPELSASLKEMLSVPQIDVPSLEPTLDDIQPDVPNDLGTLLQTLVDCDAQLTSSPQLAGHSAFAVAVDNVNKWISAFPENVTDTSAVDQDSLLREVLTTLLSLRWFSGASESIKLLFAKNLSRRPFEFLTSLWVEEMSPSPIVLTHSLLVLNTLLCASAGTTHAPETTGLMPLFMIPLSSNSKHVRQATLRCLETLQQRSLEDALVQDQLVVLRALCELLSTGQTGSNIQVQDETRVVEWLCDMLAFNQRVVREAAQACLKQLSLSAGSLLPLLSPPHVSADADAVRTAPQLSRKGSRRGKAMTAPAAQTLIAPELQMQRSTAVLELLLYKDNVSCVQDLIKPLFLLLSWFFEHSTQVDNPFEYNMQITLQVLQQLSQRFESEIGTTPALASKLLPLYNVDLVAQSVRTSKNPETTTQALLLLGTVARLFPQQAIQHAMTIFSFMSDSMMKQDSNYVFHVIEQTIMAVVPPVCEQPELTASLLRMFTTAFVNIPAHRRERLFVSLISALGTENLAALLLLLQQAHLSSPSLNALEFLHSLLTQFEIEAQLSALTIQLQTLYGTKCTLLQYLGRPTDAKQMHNLGKLATQFCSEHLASKSFLVSVAAASGDSQPRIQEVALELFETMLLQLRAVTDSLVEQRRQGDRQNAAESQAVLDVMMDAVSRLNDLLTTEAYVQAIIKLLSHPDAHIRRRALNHFVDRIAAHRRRLTKRDQAVYVQMAQHISQILRSGDELSLNIQTALLTLEALANLLAKQQPEAFVEAASAVIAAIRRDDAEVRCSAMLCLASLTKHLGPRMIAHLPAFFPLLLSTLQSCVSQPASEGMTVLSALTSLDVVLSQLHGFVSPYLSTVLTTVLHPGLLNYNSAESQKRISNIISGLSEHISPRLLLAPITDCYPSACRVGAVSVSRLFRLIQDVIERMDDVAVRTYNEQLLKLFLQGFDYRAEAFATVPQITDVETATVNAFMALVLKLSGNLFRPIFLKLMEWVSYVDSKREPRTVVWFVLIDALAGTLKNLFVPYFSYVMEEIIAHLNKPVASDPETQEKKRSKRKKAAAVEFTQIAVDPLVPVQLSALHKLFLFDTEATFVSKDRFSAILPALINQLSNVATDQELVIQCLAQLAVCVNAEDLWKTLNHQVLMQTRDENPRIRIRALLVCKELYHRLGEQLLSLVPETVPFIAELLEDEDEAVEATCQIVVKVIEEHLGESLQPYLQ